MTLAQTADVACPISNIAPGDTNSAACTFTATYNGSLPAYLGVDVTVKGTAAATVPAGYGYTHAPAPLYDGTAGGLGITISDGATTYMSGQTVNSLPLANDGTVDDLLVSTTADPGGTSTKHLFYDRLQPAPGCAERIPGWKRCRDDHL